MILRAPSPAVAAAIAIAAGGLAAAPAPAAERFDFVTSYQRPANADYDVYYDELRHERFLESVAEELNRVLELPATVTLQIAECGHSTTSWNAATRAVTICYEFLDAVVVIAGENAGTPEHAAQLFSGAVTFALFTDVGQALVGLYSLPAPQGVARAGDEFAAITLAAAEHEGDAGSEAALEFYDAALKEPESGLEFLETHGFDRPRLETVACILYGNAPASHVAALARGLLPPDRASHCADETLAVAKAWELYLNLHGRPTPPPAPPAPAPAPAAGPAARPASATPRA